MAAITTSFTSKKCRSAFTLAELLVASVVMTTALLGVNALFQHAMGAEAQATIRWNERASAQAVAAHLAETVENVVNIPEISTLKIESYAEDAGLLICQVGLKRNRYSWSMDVSGTGLSLMLQTMVFGGTANLTISPDLDEADHERAWDRIPAKVIATHLKSISVQSKLLEDSSTDWHDRWEGRSGKVAIKIEVQVGNQTAEQIIVPRTNTGFVN